MQPSPNRQAGFALLESVLGILIFSIGILALVGLQGTAAKQAAGSQYRTEAALAANELVGEMWVSNHTTAALTTNFATGGTNYVAWLARLTNIGQRQVLPGIATTPPTVTVTAVTGASGSATSSLVTVTIFWTVPGSATTNSYVVTAQIK